MSRASVASVLRCRRPGPMAVAIAIALLAAQGGVSTAVAQQAQSETPQQEPVKSKTGDAAAADAKELDTIIVTGSRIRREPGFEGPAPVTSVSAEAIRISGQTQIADLLNQLPAFAVSQSDQTSNNPDVGNVGINALDLRGMGVQRTLTLVDGRRQVPSIPGTSGVDVSMLPASMIQRVEVVTGGASALYGADAVNGVVNFILKDDYEGLEASTRYSDSSRGDMPSYSADILFGKNFADNRGNFTLYGFWEKDDGSVSGQDRPWTANGFPLYERPPGGGKYVVTEGNRNFYNSSNANVVIGNCTQANWTDCLYTFSPDGQLRRPQLGPGGLTNLDTSQLINADTLLQQGRTNGGEYGGRYDNWFLVVPSDRQSIRSTLNFDFSEAARFFGSVNYSQSQSHSTGSALATYGSGYAESVPYYSPFITQDMIDANGGAFTQNISFARNFDNDVGLTRTDYERKLLQVVAGLEGDFELFSRPWNYSAYLSYGRSKERVRSRNVASYDRLIEGLNSYEDYLDTDGDSDFTEAACYNYGAANTPGCVAINPFARLTPAMVNWLTYDTDWTDTTMTQKVASAYASGGLFNLPGGEVQLVVGAEFRKERNDIGVNPQYDPDDPRYDPTFGVTSTPLVGEYSVKEIFGELHIPLLNGVTGAERLSLDLAGRLSDYNVAGRTATSKIGLEWAPIDDITLRGTWGKAIRAPNIAEMYTAASVSGLWVYDPCNDYSVQYRADRTQFTAANCAAISPSDTATYWQWRDIVNSGNTDLEPETAKTTTLGVVLRPRFINNLTVSADYYRIDLRGVIASLAPQTILNRCVDQASLDNPFCSLVTRDADGNLVEVAVQQLNLSQSIARGVDINASWFHLLADSGSRISVDVNLGRTLERKDIADPEHPEDAWDYVGLFGTPKWKGSTRTGWSTEKASVYWTLRMVGAMSAGSTITGENYERPRAGNTFYNDFYASYNFTPKVSVQAGMNNAFDRAPPRIPGAEAGGANFNQALSGYQAGLYDVIGRTFYLGLRVSM